MSEVHWSQGKNADRSNPSQLDVLALPKVLPTLLFNHPSVWWVVETDILLYGQKIPLTEPECVWECFSNRQKDNIFRATNHQKDRTTFSGATILTSILAGWQKSVGVLGNVTAPRKEGVSGYITPTTGVNYFRGLFVTDINAQNGIIGHQVSSVDSLWQE